MGSLRWVRAGFRCVLSDKGHADANRYLAHVARESCFVVATQETTPNCQTGQAQRLERETVLHDLGYLRQAAALPHAHVICGEGGTFLHLGWTTVSTLAPIERFPLAAFAVARGTSFIDIRP